LQVARAPGEFHTVCFSECSNVYRYGAVAKEAAQWKERQAQVEGAWKQTPVLREKLDERLHRYLTKHLEHLAAAPEAGALGASLGARDALVGRWLYKLESS
jgi:hypothetical protein